MHILQRPACRRGLNRLCVPSVWCRDHPVLPVQGTEYSLHLPEMRIRGTVRHGKRCRDYQGHPGITEIDLGKLKIALKEKLPGIQDIKEEPIGFGLKALKFAVIVNDAGGETDAIEGKLNTIPGVERAEIIEVTLT